MAFWRRKKKKKKKKETKPLSQAAAVAATAAALGPEPPSPVAPLRLPIQDADAPWLELDALGHEVLTLDELAFRPLSVAEIVQPFVNPKHPDLFGTPNWLFEYFLEMLRDASVAVAPDFEKLVVVWRGPEHPHFAFIYTEGRKVLPVWFDHDQIFPWLSTIGGIQGPCEIEAKLSGFKSQKSVLNDQSDLADFLRENDPSPEVAAVQDTIRPTPSPVDAVVVAPPPSPQASALVPRENLDGDAPAIQREGLEPGTLSLDSLAFRRVALPDLPAPFIDPAHPEHFGEPNYAISTLVEHLRVAMHAEVDQLEMLLIQEQSNQDPHVAFAYTRDRSILPVWFDGELPAWLAALRQSSDRAFELRVPSSGGYQSGSAIHDISPDIASFMLASAPASWQGSDDKAAKQKVLDDALAANTRRSNIDPTTVAEVWRTLIETTGAKPNPPASDDEIAAFETATGLTLPPELVAMLQVHNGADGAFGMMTMMSVAEMLVQWQEWKGIFDEWPLAELVGSSKSPTEEALGIYTTPLWIPLVDESTGNFAALDLVPGPKGSFGQIIYFGSDESHSIKVLATDLGDFLAKQLTYVNAEIETHGEFNSQNSSCFY